MDTFYFVLLLNHTRLPKIKCITCITSSSSAATGKQQHRRWQRPQRATTNPIYVFILAINIWKMRNTEYMHFNLITLTCIAHPIQWDATAHKCSWHSLVNSSILRPMQPFLFTHIFLPVLFLPAFRYYLCRKCKWQNVTLPKIYWQSICGGAILPFEKWKLAWNDGNS